MYSEKKTDIQEQNMQPFSSTKHCADGQTSRDLNLKSSNV